MLQTGRPVGGVVGCLETDERGQQIKHHRPPPLHHHPQSLDLRRIDHDDADVACNAPRGYGLGVG